MKQIIKKLMPPILFDLCRYMRRKKSVYYFGKFSTFAQAKNKCLKGGYIAPDIINKVNASTQKVRNGEALYEQDGVCFYEPNNNYELLAALLYCKMKLGRISVLDFGGALGSTYFRYRGLFDEMNVKWSVVEQKHYVDCGQEKVPEISFYYNVEEAVSSEDIPNVLLASGVLQYFDEPYMWLKEMLTKGFEFIILDRTAFNINREAEKSIMLQYVPVSIYEAIYPVNILGQNEISSIIDHSSYEVMWEWIPNREKTPILDGLWFKDTMYKGMLLKKK